MPNKPKKGQRPKDLFGPWSHGTTEQPPRRKEDADLWKVRDELKVLDLKGMRMGLVIRDCFDQAYDGQRTGRWDYMQLSKTEKTHIGTLVEIGIRKEFGFEEDERGPGGARGKLDFLIKGVPVDCKWALNLYEWYIPKEMYQDEPKIAMVVWGNEYTKRWSLGLIRIEEKYLKAEGRQRDKKRTLNEAGRDRILWVFKNARLIENTLLHAKTPAIDEIRYSTNGQTAVTTLFRSLTERLVNRATVITAGAQIDPGKRVRDARKQLKRHGIVIFGHYEPHPTMAQQLGLPRPTLGSFVSARLVPWNDGDARPYTEIEGSRWRLARKKDPVTPAPRLPRQGNYGSDG
ncbi:NaeI family type II restriction endonuclease [Actinoplanes sp. NPDC023936]|uniref:NaeI family type II restriction endonuclease n=1 Tax=Actinoplanes sp. NPDC023936 TaxID=3154910 RepID=UPI00340057DC